MRDALMLLAATLAAVAGMGWLALAKDGHWRQACGNAPRPPRQSMRLRCLGALALGVSLGCCLAADPAPIAALVWVMLATAAALAVAFTLTWRPRWLRVLAWGVRPSRRTRG